MQRISIFIISLFMLPMPGEFALQNARAASEVKTPISLTVSGGVSLGSYEAGYLYYHSRFIHENKLNLDLKLVTGASAGAINAFLSILSACSFQEGSQPSESLFWNTWMPVGFQDLLGTPSRQKASAAFTTEALEKSGVGIEKIWQNGLDEKCDVVLGVATTLLKPSQVTLADGIQTAHQEEPFVVRIKGRGKGQAPEISNYINPADGIPHALLYLPEEPHERFVALEKLLLASAAFPGAFPPVALNICRSDQQHELKECKNKDAHDEYFIDGGVFDNEPLRLASRIGARGLQKEPSTQKSFGSKYSWATIPNLDQRSPPQALQFKVVDIDAKTFPAELPVTEINLHHEDEPILQSMQEFVARFVITARSQQLYSILEENPELANSIQSSKNNFPLASEPGLGFLGFFDKGFREFDFYVGMYDAKKIILHAKENQNKNLRFPEAVGSPNEDWQTFACVEATLNHDVHAETLCKKPVTQNTRALLQLSLNRLYSTCSRLKGETNILSFPSEDCRKAAHGASPPQVEPNSANENWLRKDDEDQGPYSVRVLNEAHYRFELLGDRKASSDSVLMAFKSEVSEAFQSLASRQPARDRFVMQFAMKPAFNIITYVPPPREFHLLIGELSEVAGSIALNRYFRVHAALTTEHFEDVFSSGRRRNFALAPAAGLEVEPKGMSNVWIQTHIGTRFGDHLVPNDSWRGRFMLEPYLALSFYQRLRVQLTEEYLPAERGLPVKWNTFLQVGLELTP